MIKLKRPMHRHQGVIKREMGEADAVPILLGEVDHGVVQAPCVAYDGDGTVAQGEQLVQTARR